MKPLPQFLASDLSTLHAELRIPPDYASARRLSFQAEPPFEHLVAFSHPTDATRQIRLLAPAATAWNAMHTAATVDGITLLPLSGFRSIARQAEIIRAKLAAGRSLAAILRVNAAPGYSEHHTGRALDLGTPGDPPFEENFAQTAAFAWLTHHATTFGFTLSFPPANRHGIAFEPWHWCWRA